MQFSSRKFAGLIVTDLDGTLMRTGGGFSAVDLEALEKAGRLGFARVIATGRSLHSFYKAVDFAMPIDFLIFSTGGGVLDCSGGKILRQINMEASSVAAAIQTLKGLGLDFMAHDPIPDNHGFAYHSTGRSNADFNRRLALYSAYCRLLDGAGDFGEAAQLLAILPDADIS
ncbi:MAG: HAD hydrolase family protein, partial [Desulfobacterales bacterium]|nr:HAD hydrolase family protein [Desulfobacterales bacterium]